MQKSHFIIILIVSAILLSCDGRPSGVPSKGKMERLLYDYHKTQAMLDVMSMSTTDNERYILGVLEKYGMDSEMFDSAMVWYNAHTKELREIYRNIEARLKAEDEELQAHVGTSEMTSIYIEGGDTTNLWNASSLIALRPDRLHNLERFTLKADTSYRRNDHFILLADTKFIKEAQTSFGILTMCLSIRTQDGKVYSQTSQTSNNEKLRIEVSQSSDSGISEISGYFYYKGENKTKSLCVINGISLIRMHVNDISADTTAVDSLSTDSMLNEKPRMNEESPDIPSIELSDSAPSTNQPEAQPIRPSRKNEVEQIQIERTPTESGQEGPRRRRMSVQESRNQNNQNNRQATPSRRTGSERRQPANPPRSR